MKNKIIFIVLGAFLGVTISILFFLYFGLNFLKQVPENMQYTYRVFYESKQEDGLRDALQKKEYVRAACYFNNLHELSRDWQYWPFEDAAFGQKFATSFEILFSTHPQSKLAIDTKKEAYRKMAAEYLAQYAYLIGNLGQLEESEAAYFQATQFDQNCDYQCVKRKGAELVEKKRVLQCEAKTEEQVKR